MPLTQHEGVQLVLPVETNSEQREIVIRFTLAATHDHRLMQLGQGLHEAGDCLSDALENSSGHE